MSGKSFNVLIGGEAGQGLVTIGEILSKSLIRSGYCIVVTQDYQSRIRGGHNAFMIRISSENIEASRENFDLIIALNLETVDIHSKDISPGGRIIADISLQIKGDSIINVPFNELGGKRLENVAALGAAAAVLGLDREIVAVALENFFGKKDQKVIEENRITLGKAFAWAEKENNSLAKFARVQGAHPRLMLNGNEAIALGALSAGVKFCSFYPMTPATSIALTLAANAEKMGLVVEQAEDEIAAINMAIGASFAGAPAIVTTSGGGFALMVEGVSLAAMTETPIAIVVAQRPAPATGLPTRTEQADLDFVLHSGHGEFARAIFAPGSIEQCFHLTRKALKCAEKFQTPVFLLTDQYLADSYRAVPKFDIDNLDCLEPITAAVENGHYKRYAITDSGISPRLLPGASKNLVVADSDEHTEDGHLTEDLEVRKKMVEKRLLKIKGICAEVMPPELRGDADPDLLLVSWGSTAGAMFETMDALIANGKKVAALHFSQIWPLVPDQFLGILEGAGGVVCIESNAFGQFARLIRRETGFHITKTINRYDGLHLNPDFILRELKKMQLA